MKASYAESVRGAQVRLEIPEPNEPARLVARRTVGSRAPNHEGLAETFEVNANNVAEFADWLSQWLIGDGTYRWFQLGRESDIGTGAKLSPRKRVKLAVSPPVRGGPS